MTHEDLSCYNQPMWKIFWKKIRSKPLWNQGWVHILWAGILLLLMQLMLSRKIWWTILFILGLVSYLIYFLMILFQTLQKNWHYPHKH